MNQRQESTSRDLKFQARSKTALCCVGLVVFVVAAMVVYSQYSRWANRNADEPPSEKERRLVELTERIRDCGGGFLYEPDSSGRPNVDSVVAAQIRKLDRQTDLSFLGELDYLQNLTIENVALTQEQQRQLERVSDSINFLWLTNVEFEGGISEGFGSFDFVNHLKLDRINISAADLTVISQMDRLSKLDVLACKIASAGLPKLRQMPSLTLLTVEDSPIPSEAFQEVFAIENLRGLFLSGRSLNDACFDDLAKAKKLDLLVISEGYVSGKFLMASNAESTVTSLSLYSCPIEDRYLKGLTQFTRLENLEITNAPITDEGCADFLPLPNLVSINLSGCPVTDKTTEKLKACPRLMEIAAYDTQMKSEVLHIDREN